MNRPSTLQEVPAHKKEAIEAKVESKKTNKSSGKVLEVEISKQRYNRLVQITDSKRNHADVVTDKEHGKKDEERKNVHIINATNKQSNDAYIGLKTNFRNIDQNSKIAKDDETGHAQISKSPSNTMKTEDDEEANTDSTEDGTEDNRNPST